MPTKAKVTLASEPTEKMTAEETKPEVKGIKMEDVEKHSSVDDLWLVIDGACRDQIWNENVHSRAGAARASAPPSSRRPLRCVLPTRICPYCHSHHESTGKVYDVTPFMDDHPGGGEIMLSAAGKDGTQDFEDVGHSPHARELLKKYYLDEFAGGVGSGKIATKSGGGGMSLLAVLLPILVVALAFAAKMLTA